MKKRAVVVVIASALGVLLAEAFNRHRLIPVRMRIEVEIGMDVGIAVDAG